jgi:hypothetical protein
MSKAHSRLAAQRASRDAAREAFAVTVARIKADVAARGVGSRIAGTVVGEASDAIDVGLDAAREHKGVVAGTIGALLLWTFRQPLFTAAVSLYERVRGGDDEDIEDDTRDEDE